VGAPLDYLAVGHVTRDVLPEGDRPGGGAFYSALQAARLGLRTGILTQGDPEEIRELLGPYLSELALEILPAPRTTTLHTRGAGPERSQRLLAWAGPIPGPLRVDTAILHLAPVARETPGEWSGRADFVGLTPQGLLREWAQDGEIRLTSPERARLPEGWNGIVLNENESRVAPIPEEIPEGSLLAVTAGAGDTALRLPGRAVAHVPACALQGAPAGTHVRDDLGAGDVFAAALFVALSEGLPPVEAAAFAAAAAALRIEGVGPAAIGDRAAVEARLRQSMPA
jgi:hypothetical protein